MRISVNIAPMGAVRMTYRGKWTSASAQRYLNYKRVIGWEIKRYIKEPMTGAVEVNITFLMPMPDSWSKAKKRTMAGQYVTVKPDVDNLVKGLFDAANKIVWTDDNLVAKCSAEKRYSATPGIILDVKALRMEASA